MFQKLSLVSLVLLVPIISGLSVACRQTTTPQAPRSAFDELSHKKEIETWQKDRIATLTKQDGWLTVIGLFWLNEGENKFGSAAAAPIRLPGDRAPLVAGTLWLANGQVRMASNPAIEITAGGVPVTSLALKDDTEAGGPTILKFGTLLMNILKRGDRVGVRVKDTDSRTRREFKGL